MYTFWMLMYIKWSILNCTKVFVQVPSPRNPERERERVRRQFSSIVHDPLK